MEAIQGLQVSVMLIIILLLVMVIYFKRKFQYWKRKGIGFLKPSIPFGNFSDFILGKRTFGEVFASQYSEIQKRGMKHGGVYFCSKPVYIPVDPEIVKHILISDFMNFPNHGLYIDESVNSKDPFSKHIFNMENYKWKNLRSKMPAIFTASKMRWYVSIMEQTSKNMIQVLDKFADNQTSVNVKNTLSNYTTDVITQCIFGTQADTLKGKNQELTKFSRAFFDSQWHRWKNILVVLVPRNVLRFFNFRLIEEEPTKFFLKMYEDIKNYRSQEGVHRNDLTEVLLRLGDENDELLRKDFTGKSKMEPLSFEEFAAQMHVFFEAGFETSSTAQTFALYLLATHQDCQQKLRDDISNVLEKHDGKITYDSLNEMKYLERVVDETLRLYPVFPILPRVCLKEYEIPGTGVVLDQNTFIMVSNMGIQRNPEYWPDPEKFDPDRFTPENKAKRPASVYVPFGDGPRVCVGKRFGLFQTKVGLATIIKNYQVTLSDKTEPGFKFVADELILRKVGDIWINFKKIQDS